MRLELLAASTRLFFRRPGEMQHMLGRLLDAAIADASFIDVHDRGLMYYRLLQHDVHKAAEILTQPSNVEGSFVEETQSELSDRIFEEFNTCASPSRAATSPLGHPSRPRYASALLPSALLARFTGSHPKVSRSQSRRLSVIYGEPAERFITNERAKKAVANAAAPSGAVPKKMPPGRSSRATLRIRASVSRRPTNANCMANMHAMASAP